MKWNKQHKPRVQVSGWLYVRSTNTVKSAQSIHRKPAGLTRPTIRTREILVGRNLARLRQVKPDTGLGRVKLSSVFVVAYVSLRLWTATLGMATASSMNHQLPCMFTKVIALNGKEYKTESTVIRHHRLQQKFSEYRNAPLNAREYLHLFYCSQVRYYD